LVRHFSAAFGRSQIFADPREIDAHAIHFVFAQALERIIDETVGKRPQFRDERLRSFGDLKPPGAPVGGIGRSLDESRFGKAVHDPAQGDRLDIQLVRELNLAKARLPAQPEKDLPLRTRNSKRGGTTIERPS